MKKKVKALTNAEKCSMYRDRKKASSNKEKPNTEAERSKGYRERKTTFDVVQLHLISNECEKQENVNFSFESRPHKEDIYFNFSGIEYFQDMYIISPNGVIREIKSAPFHMERIHEYAKKHSEIEICDDIDIQKEMEKENYYKEIPWSEDHATLVTNSKQEAEKISNLCSKYMYAMDIEGMLKYPFNTNTRKEITKIIAHWKDTGLSNLPKSMICPECGKQYSGTYMYPAICDECLKRYGITHNVINNAMIGYMKKHDDAIYTHMKNHEDETTGNINW